MGAGQSAPLAVEELSKPYTCSPALSPALYEEHSSGGTGGLLAGLLTEVPPDLLGRVTLHRELDLSYNLLSALPAELPLCLPHLTCLNLAHNRITTVPDSIFGFLHLTRLDLSHNLLEQLPASLGLLSQLAKLDLSHNLLTDLPGSLEGLNSLQALNLAANRLEEVPAVLAQLPLLAVLLLTDNPSPHSQLSSRELLARLRTPGLGSPRPARAARPAWARVRGPVFDSSVLNAGSAQAEFVRLQEAAVQTGSRLLTPLVPPPGGTRLGVERLRDAVAGLYWGAALGDSLGLRTLGMTGDEAEFHYGLCGLSGIVKDQARAGLTSHSLSPATGLALLTLDSLTRWAGVVDELDYSARLAAWWADQPAHSAVLVAVTADPAFLESPTHTASRHAAIKDSYCLSPVLGLVASHFHNLEVSSKQQLHVCTGVAQH